jgi:hypothetical protein
MSRVPLCSTRREYSAGALLQTDTTKHDADIVQLRMLPTIPTHGEAMGPPGNETKVTPSRGDEVMSSTVQVSMKSAARSRLARARDTYTTLMCVACVWGAYIVTSSLWRAVEAIEVVA